MCFCKEYIKMLAIKSQGKKKANGKPQYNTVSPANSAIGDIVLVRCLQKDNGHKLQPECQ